MSGPLSCSQSRGSSCINRLNTDPTAQAPCRSHPTQSENPSASISRLTPLLGLPPPLNLGHVTPNMHDMHDPADSKLGFDPVKYNVGASGARTPQELHNVTAAKLTMPNKGLVA